MKKWWVGVALLLAVIAGPAGAKETMMLREGWRLQSSTAISAAAGDAISRPGFDAGSWYPTSVPRTVLAALVDNGVYPDPFYGTNLKSIPGYVDGRWLAMPKDSPFYPPWWYRLQFKAPASLAGKNVVLHLDGVNYQANVWLNGQKIAGSDQVIGMFRAFEFPVSGALKPGEDNVIAVEVIAPGKLPRRPYLTKQVQATTGWDDHNPYPPDMNLGLWRDVYLTVSGPARVLHPYVATDLPLPALAPARLTVSAYVRNLTAAPVTGELTGVIEGVSFKQAVSLAAGEEKLVTFTPEAFPQLVLAQPRLWWPHPLGPQNLYDCALVFTVANQVSDDAAVRFGIREVNTYINDENWRVYEVNGRKVLIRGGAWMTSDMLLRLSNHRYDALVRYAREANLNMLRSEGFSIRETEDFYNACDRHGVMVTQQIFGRNLPDEKLAIACIRDMMLRIRVHPSLVHFLGHDETFPTPSLDQAYRGLIAELDVRRTYQPHSGAFNVKDRAETGGTRTGTLELWTYAGPAHYYTHKDDGAWGFAQSGGIGGVFAPIESIRRMMPEDQLWPPLKTEAWSFHTVIQGGKYFDKLVEALNQRYGPPQDIDDFVRTGHLMNYESARGMYEAYGRNKYDATGLTTWKYDAAWPAALTWQYVDWYLLPTGAYYGAKKACEAIHVQYSYDDDSIWVVNTLSESFTGLKVSAKLLNFDLAEKFAREATVDVGPDGKTRAFVIDRPAGLTKSFFLQLRLTDAAGKPVSDNFYWLSTVPDLPGKKFKGVIPVGKNSIADHTELRQLPPAKVEATCTIGDEGGEKALHLTLTNASPNLAFFLQLALTRGPSGLEVAPSFWSDNDLALLPSETKTLQVKFASADLEGQEPVVRVSGWNVGKVECKP
jgi:exo-1,4-beta-D-glucosaminidase